MDRWIAWFWRWWDARFSGRDGATQRESSWIGCSFYSSTFNGCSMNETAEPIILGDPANGNIAWPEGWTPEQARDYRMAHNIPGPEWKGV